MNNAFSADANAEIDGAREACAMAVPTSQLGLAGQYHLLLPTNRGSLAEARNVQ